VYLFSKLAAFCALDFIYTMKEGLSVKLPTN